MASIDRCSVLVGCCCFRRTERSTVALERSSTSTVPSADCLIDAAVDSSATAVRHSATAMADEQPRKMFLSLSSCVSSMKLSGASLDTGSTNEHPKPTCRLSSILFQSYAKHLKRPIMISVSKRVNFEIFELGLARDKLQNSGGTTQNLKALDSETERHNSLLNGKIMLLIVDNITPRFRDEIGR
ncbi:unnamed protein product [Cuscuta campestris]|uniref:Uncharacterized protein n=1 Tax=Cuscuta campestris TaxID=132261 RepID=A0A484M4B3_9ASTE|nr:unnamed protein product [Cuscuta campestris]